MRMKRKEVNEEDGERQEGRFRWREYEEEQRTGIGVREVRGN